jgi:hypothetical protein
MRLTPARRRAARTRSFGSSSTRCGESQLDRIAFRAGARRVAVDLVTEQDAARHAPKPARAVRADDGHAAAGKALVVNRVAAVFRLWLHENERPQRRAVAQHRRELFFTEPFRVFERRLHDEDRTRVVVDVIADDDVDDFVYPTRALFIHAIDSTSGSENASRMPT